MNYKKHDNRKKLWRKECNPINSIAEWSKHLHLWWKKDVISKRDFKQQNRL